MGRGIGGGGGGGFTPESKTLRRCRQRQRPIWMWELISLTGRSENTILCSALPISIWISCWIIVWSAAAALWERREFWGRGKIFGGGILGIWFAEGEEEEDGGERNPYVQSYRSTSVSLAFMVFVFVLSFFSSFF